MGPNKECQSSIQTWRVSPAWAHHQSSHNNAFTQCSTTAIKQMLAYCKPRLPRSRQPRAWPVEERKTQTTLHIVRTKPHLPTTHCCTHSEHCAPIMLHVAHQGPGAACRKHNRQAAVEHLWKNSSHTSTPSRACTQHSVANERCAPQAAVEDEKHPTPVNRTSCGIVPSLLEAGTDITANCVEPQCRPLLVTA